MQYTKKSKCLRRVKKYFGPLVRRMGFSGKSIQRDMFMKKFEGAEVATLGGLGLKRDCWSGYVYCRISLIGLEAEI